MAGHYNAVIEDNVINSMIDPGYRRGTSWHPAKHTTFTN
jgi:hypothetical protein